MKLIRTTAGIVTVAAITVGSAVPATADTQSAIQMSWDGTDYADTTSESFVGFPTVVPGDSATRTLQVRNDGPTDATLRVSIGNVELLDPQAVDVGNFYDDLHIDWNGGSAAISDLDAAGTTRILTIDLARGEVAPVTIGYDFPVESTSGNKANVALREGSFDVLFALGGDEPSSDRPGDDVADGTLPRTGGVLWWTLAAGALLVGVGTALLRMVHRKR